MKNPFEPNLNPILLVIFITLISVSLIYKKISKPQIYSNKIIKNDFFIEGNTKVIDGDSIYVAGKEIRLFDIDTPEYNQICKDKMKKEYNCGLSAKKFLKTFVHNKPSKCKILKKDYYDRYLGICFHNGENINQKLIRSGWAVLYGKESQYLKDEQYAKTHKQGIWQGEFIHPKKWRKIERKQIKN
jgi:endonuclease YncB( thermonuclease family)